jgi:hypothetical protein
LAKLNNSKILDILLSNQEIKENLSDGLDASLFSNPKSIDTLVFMLQSGYITKAGTDDASS